MSGTITHSWNGTILTITSDSGTSSADLKGDKGDDGIRGAQGIQGESGSNVDLSAYATTEYVDKAISAVEPEIDLSSYYTKEEVDNLIPEVDLSNYATKDELNGLATETYVNNAVATKQNAVYYSTSQPTGWVSGDIWLKPAE